MHSTAIVTSVAMTSGIQYCVLFAFATAEIFPTAYLSRVPGIFIEDFFVVCQFGSGKKNIMLQTKQNDYERVRKDLEQLRREVRIDRMKVSKSVEE